MTATSPAERMLATIKACAEFYGVSVDAVLGVRRNSEVLLPRYAAAYVLHHRDGYSFSALGRRFGGRDHSTILNAVSVRAPVLIADDPLFAMLVGELMDRRTPPAPARAPEPKPAPAPKPVAPPRPAAVEFLQRERPAKPDPEEFEVALRRSALKRGSRMLLAAVRRYQMERVAA